MLEIGSLAEVVTVAAQGTTVETRNSDYSGLLTLEADLADSDRRGATSSTCCALLPGVHYENDIDAMGDSFGSQILNIAGQRRTWNQVTVDGLNGNELSGTNRMNSSINLDAIAEVKVLLNTYKAEFGHSAGAEHRDRQQERQQHLSRQRLLVSGAATPGTRRRGKTKRAGIAKPKQKIDTPGFNLGGPVKLPWLDKSDDQKLFFFYSMEAPQVQKPGQVRLYRMPTALERTGQFLADLRRQRPADVHQGSAVERRLQRHDRRARLLPRQHHPGEPSRSERAGAAEHDAAAERRLHRSRIGALSNFTRQETPKTRA